jgi:hypothetical protein
LGACSKWCGTTVGTEKLNQGEEKMRRVEWKVLGTLAVMAVSGALFAGCETSETVTVEAGPGGAAVIVDECDATSTCPGTAKAKCAMQPSAKTTATTAATAADKTKGATTQVSRKHQCPLTQFEAESSKLASTLAHAFKNGDAKAFVAALPENLRKNFDEKKFLEAHKLLTDAMGEVVSADFVTDLKHPLLSIRLWKIGFKKISKDAGEITQQVLFQVSIGEVDKKAQVVSFGFIW